ncbi:TetR/AcrR family transcriptional regulator [Vallitalea okinawensis]|uniref:TetR/AcrR family transcriptional regulator n=1 Tax=Vallitalea okinawensis TaxID=2078660 RepID=UPI000CFAC855|nr:TetR/AcrR family transcriptional regulator [Vallitalea okinawensis]
MPSQTFFNLPEEKKSKILHAAIDEFARTTYKDSSIAHIIKAAGIPRGSFYQYFEDKKDLYMYIIDTLAAEKAEVFKPIFVEMDQYSFSELYTKLCYLGVDFGLEHPKYLAISEFLLMDTELKKEVYSKHKSKSDNIYTIMLNQANARGELREGIDIKIASDMLFTVSNTMIENYYKENPKDHFQNLKEYMDGMIDILKHGLLKEK